MAGHLLAVRMRAGIDEDRKPVKWKVAKFWPNLFGHDAVTMYRTVRCVKSIDYASPGFVRHELHHVYQAAQWLPWFPWLGATLFGVWYLINPWFRRRIEKDAQARAFDAYPQVRVIGTISSGWWLW